MSIDEPTQPVVLNAGIQPPGMESVPPLVGGTVPRTEPEVGGGATEEASPESNVSSGSGGNGPVLGSEKKAEEVPPEVAIAMGRFKKGEFFPLKGVWFEVIGFVSGRMVLYPVGYTAKDQKRWAK